MAATRIDFANLAVQGSGHALAGVAHNLVWSVNWPTNLPIAWIVTVGVGVAGAMNMNTPFLGNFINGKTLFHSSAAVVGFNLF